MKFRDLPGGTVFKHAASGGKFLKFVCSIGAFLDERNAVWLTDESGFPCYFHDGAEVEPIELEWIDAGVFNRVR